jgi:hypothetical protein
MSTIGLWCAVRQLYPQLQKIRSTGRSAAWCQQRTYRGRLRSDQAPARFAAPMLQPFVREERLPRTPCPYQRRIPSTARAPQRHLLTHQLLLHNCAGRRSSAIRSIVSKAVRNGSNFPFWGKGGKVRRVAPVVAHSGIRLLSEPKAGTQPCRREPLFMPRSCPPPAGHQRAGLRERDTYDLVAPATLARNPSYIRAQPLFVLSLAQTSANSGRFAEAKLLFRVPIICP